MTDSPVPLSRWEIVGAWLHVWTPPRNAEVPPVPWGRLGLAGLVLAAAVAAFVAFAVPAIDKGKKRSAAETRRAQAALAAAERRRLIRESRVHRGASARPAKLTLAARQAVISDLESAVQADALARVKAGRLRGPIAATTCRPYPNTPTRRAADGDLTLTRLGYECLARRNADVAFGYDFLASVDYRRATFTWCKVAPSVGEGGRALAVVPVPEACTTPWPPKR